MWLDWPLEVSPGRFGGLLTIASSSMISMELNGSSLPNQALSQSSMMHAMSVGDEPKKKREIQRRLVPSSLALAATLE